MTERKEARWKRTKEHSTGQPWWEQILPQLLRAAQGETVLNALPSVIHELNNALNTVLGFVDLWQSEPTLSKAIGEDLQALMRAGMKARGLLGTLRLLADGVPPQVQIALIDLQELCEEVVQVMAAAFRRRSIRLSADYGSPSPSLLSDPTRLRFILLALLQNACDAIAKTGQGGQIFLRVAQADKTHVPLQHQWVTESVIITVENEGGSIDAQVRDRLFHPFVTTKPVGKGAGLGLFLVQRFVAELQGTVELTEKATGTAITIVLPSLSPQS